MHSVILIKHAEVGYLLKVMRRKIYFLKAKLRRGIDHRRYLWRFLGCGSGTLGSKICSLFILHA
jgi:hypothetical protein